MAKKPYAAAVLLFCTAAFCLSLGAQALAPALEASAPYGESAYYERLCAVELTGRYRQDLVNVALSQVGYHEGDGKDGYAGDSTGGFHNFTEYASAYYGLDRPWCAIFVSWCARQAGIPKTVINSACGAYVDNNGGKYGFRMTVHYKKNYTPLAGDLVFFTSSGWGTSHVGIVVKVADGGLYTVEGNSMDAVRVRYYPLDSSEIVYYGVYTWDTEGAAADLSLSRLRVVCTDGQHGTMPDGDPYHFDTLYALHGRELTLPKGGFAREGYTLAGYYVRRESDGAWYCGDSWQAAGAPALVADGASWCFDGAWAEAGDLTLYCVWADGQGALVPDSALPAPSLGDGLAESGTLTGLGTSPYFPLTSGENNDIICLCKRH